MLSTVLHTVANPDYALLIVEANHEDKVKICTEKWRVYSPEIGMSLWMGLE